MNEPQPLCAGDPHYHAYVGPPDQFDWMGATQFQLLTSLGLRSRHRVLDFGCGSLRAGRLLIPFLDANRYFGVEPNRWLVEEAFEKDLGEGLRARKRPVFSWSDAFSVSGFGEKFDFIVAQSIFSHTGKDLLAKALAEFRANLADGGLIAATFYEDRKDFEGEGWVYPHCVRFRRKTILSMARGAGLAAVRLPWFHPRQTWYLLSASREDLPPRRIARNLKGQIWERERPPARV